MSKILEAWESIIQRRNGHIVKDKHLLWRADEDEIEEINARLGSDGRR